MEAGIYWQDRASVGGYDQFDELFLLLGFGEGVEEVEEKHKRAVI